MDLEMQEILKVFFEESFEGLDAMESGLLHLDANADRETINNIFRAAHSIKGGAGTFGFMQISQFTHNVETLLDEMRNGQRPVTTEAVQVLLQAVDVMRGMTKSAQADEPVSMTAADALSVDLERILRAAATAPVVPAAAPAPTPAAAAAPAPTAVPAEPAVTATADAPSPGLLRVDFTPDRSLFRTCNDPLRIFGQLELLAPVAVTARTAGLPAFAEFDPTQCYIEWSVDVAAPVEQARVTEIFDWVDSNSRITYEWVAKAPVIAAPRAAAEVTATLAFVPGVVQTEAVGDGPPRRRATDRLPDSSAIPQRRVTDKMPDAASIRVGTEKVDALINLVGELVITNSMLSRFADHYDPADLDALKRGLAALSRNTRELQEGVLQIRMLPISFSFNRFPRLVHELSRQLGKKVELKMTGEQTELDKIVLEKIGDPLVHLVRNSLDHGIEMPQDRLAAGKSETGVLHLNAFHEGGNIIIEVSDDGGGLNKQRILSKARQRGLVDPGAVLSDEQIHNLIFEPGFSTAEIVSDVSGRGVGMDVVRRNINDLGGQVHVHSREGKGSTIRIRLPLTLSILEGQMLRVGREIYVISLVSIIETVQPKRAQISTIAGTSELFQYRDGFLPILRLHEMFGIEPDDRDLTRGLLIVVESEGQRVAIHVDELRAQQQVVIKSLETNFKQVPGVAGATIHGDGTVALILDVPGLMTKFLKEADRRSTRAA